MGKVIQLRPQQEKNTEVIKMLRVLLKKAYAGQIRGLAFVALKTTGPCAGIAGIEDGFEAIDVAETLIDAINGDDQFVVPLD